ERVLDRLERADRHVELHALARVRDGERDQPVAHAEQLRRGGERAAVEGIVEQLARTCARRDACLRSRLERNGRDAPGWIVVRLRSEPDVAGRGRVQLPVALEQQEI